MANTQGGRYTITVLDRSIKGAPPVPKQVEVLIDVDLKALAETLGRKAYSNRTKVSKEVGGLVVAKVVTR